MKQEKETPAYVHFEITHEEMKKLSKIAKQNCRSVRSEAKSVILEYIEKNQK